MMCSLKKNAVIFQVDTDAKDPIIVIEQKYFTKEEPDSTVPLLGIYNGHHYQSVLPASKEDEELTEQIVKYFPKFEGNFKSFLAHNANQQKMKKVLVPTSVRENSGSENVIFKSKPTYYGASSICDVPLSEESNLELGGINSRSKNEQENEAINRTYTELTLGLENSENKEKNEELIINYRETDLEQENPKNDGSNISNYETVLEPENYENKINNERIDSNYKKPALKSEISEKEAKNEGIHISNQEEALEQENFENKAKHVEINSTFEKYGSEQDNSENGAKNKRMSSSYEEYALKQDNSEVGEKGDRGCSSYEEQRTKHLYASNTHKKEGGHNLFISKDNKVMHLY